MVLNKYLMLVKVLLASTFIVHLSLNLLSSQEGTGTTCKEIIGELWLRQSCKAYACSNKIAAVVLEKLLRNDRKAGYSLPESTCLNSESIS